MTLALHSTGGNQPLNLGCLGVPLLVPLSRNLTTNNVLAHIILLGQVEHLPNVTRPLGTQTLGNLRIRQPRDIRFTLLDNYQRQGRNIAGDNASTNGFTFTFTRTTRTVAGVAFGKKETDSTGFEDTLLHGETLFVVSAGDFEDVAFEFVAEGVAFDVLRHALFVEDTAIVV